MRNATSCPTSPTATTPRPSRVGTRYRSTASRSASLGPAASGGRPTNARRWPHDPPPYLPPTALAGEALIPADKVGSYILYRACAPIYIGRSDTDLRRRLVQHAAAGTGEYFRYDVHPNPTRAFRAECSLYHAVDGPLVNRIHPDAPDYLDIDCAFCNANLHDVLDNRLVAYL